MRQDAMKCQMHWESYITCSSLYLNIILCLLWVILGVSYLLTIEPAAGTLVCTVGVELVFVWIQKLCYHYMFQ